MVTIPGAAGERQPGVAIFADVPSSLRSNHFCAIELTTVHVNDAIPPDTNVNLPLSVKFPKISWRRFPKVAIQS